MKISTRMRIRQHLSIFAVIALLSVVIGCSSQKVTPHFGQLVVSTFEERPFYFNCSPGPSQRDASAFATGSSQQLYTRLRSDALELSRNEVPALTVGDELMNVVQIATSPQDHWIVQYCATGKGNTPEEADGNLRKVSMQRTGGLLTLNNTGAGGSGHLLLEAPAGAPVTVHSDNPVEIHDLSGPVRISSLGLVEIRNTTGRLDVWAKSVSFAGSQGSVFLNTSQSIDFMITGTNFQGSLGANAQHRVNAYFPPGFQTTVDVFVISPKDFICRADFCSKIKKDREGGLYRFTYGDAKGTTDRIGIRSMDAEVVLDTVP